MSLVLLVHHGEAVAPGLDAMRPLSTAGWTATERLAALAAQRGVRPDAVWHSGKLRARQTAELFWKTCNPLASFSAERGLQPDDPPQWMLDRLMGETRSIIIAGHMPHLPRLLAAMRGGPRDSDSAAFPEHGCVALEPEGEQWTELWRLRTGD